MFRRTGLLREAPCAANSLVGVASGTPMKSTALAPLDDGKAWTGGRGTTKAQRERLIASGFVRPVVIRPLPLGQESRAMARSRRSTRCGPKFQCRGAKCAAFSEPNQSLTVIPARCHRALGDRLNGRSGTRIWQATASSEAFRDVAANWQQESRNPPAGGGFGLRDAGR